MKLHQNRLLGLLGPDVLSQLGDALEPIDLRQGQVLYESMQVIENVFFLTSGFSSEIPIDPSGQRIEVGCIGNEGFAGQPVMLGVDRSPHKSFMETDGRAYQVSTDKLRATAKANDALMSILLRYVHVFMMQVAATALADGRYNIAQRTARWLLMAHDRLDGDELPLTHEFLSLMLGVRRSSVTTALHVVEGEGAIKASRSLITVRSRSKLEKLAGGSYGLPENEYERVLGGARNA